MKKFNARRKLKASILRSNEIDSKVVITFFYIYRVLSLQQCWPQEISQVCHILILLQPYKILICLQFRSLTILFLKFLILISLLTTKQKGKSMIAKKSDGSQAKEKESTDSSTTIEDDDVKGRSRKSQFSSQKR